MSEEVKNVEVPNTSDVETLDVSLLAGSGIAAKEVEEENTSKEEETTTVNYILNPDIYIYVDMEFTGLRRDASLISIALCTAQGHSFYAEFTDFDYSQITPWILENVLKYTVNPPTHLEGDHWTMRGTRKEITKNLMYWLDAVREHTGSGIQFVGDVSHYDFVFLIDLLWGNATVMPEWVCADIVNLNQDLANVTHEMMKRNDDPNGVPLEYNPYFTAFDTDREEYAKFLPGSVDGIKHNALHDAYIIRAIHQHIWEIETEFSPLEEKNKKEETTEA